jgi:hypothetical protein
MSVWRIAALLAGEFGERRPWEILAWRADVAMEIMMAVARNRSQKSEDASQKEEGWKEGWMGAEDGVKALKAIVG